MKIGTKYRSIYILKQLILLISMEFSTVIAPNTKNITLILGMATGKSGFINLIGQIVATRQRKIKVSKFVNTLVKINREGS